MYEVNSYAATCLGRYLTVLLRYKYLYSRSIITVQSSDCTHPQTHTSYIADELVDHMQHMAVKRLQGRQHTPMQGSSRPGPRFINISWYR